MERKKVLIFYTAIGQGHKVMAENIAYWLREIGYEVVLKDALKTQGGFLAEQGERLYLTILRFWPGLWHWLYNAKFLLPLRPLRSYLARFNSDKILKMIRQERPDAVITTQITINSVLAYLRKSGKYAGPWAISFSDYHFHPYWFFSEADSVLINISEQASSLRDLNYPGHKIFQIGLSLPPPVAGGAKDVKNRLGIPVDHKVVLLSGGSLGYGLNVRFIEALSEAVKGQSITVLVITGTNKKLLDMLETMNLSQVKSVGFYSPLDELYSISSVLVGKPGGLTVAECLRIGLPIFVTAAMPGQELANLKYLEKRSLVISLLDCSEFSAISKILNAVRNTNISQRSPGNELAGENLPEVYRSFVGHLLG